MNNTTYPNGKTATHALMNSVPYGSGLRWTLAPVSGWMESLNGKPTGKTANITKTGKRVLVQIIGA